MCKRTKFLLMGLLLSLCVASFSYAQPMYQMTEQNWAAGDFGGRDYGDYSYNFSALPAAAGIPGPHIGMLVLNPEEKGDLLLFPYYDVRTINGKTQETLFIIINETSNLGTAQLGDQGIVAKLRFHEWDKSEEVFDAEIWLSDADVWVGLLRLNANTGLCNIWSPDYVVYDATATAPFPAATDHFVVKKLLDNAGAGYDFLTQMITLHTHVGYPPAGWTAAQMTQVGYFEVIGSERTKTKIDTLQPEWVYRLTTGTTAFSQYPDCPNTLMGLATLVRVSDGVAKGYKATAIANFSRTRGSLYVGPGAPFPDLTSGQDTLDQLEFQISKQDIFAAYSIEPTIGGQASVIVTFPTKFFHYLSTDLATPRIRIGTSNNPFMAAKANAGEIITLIIWDRNENKITPDKSWWSPPPQIPPLSLPYEVNICGLYPGMSPAVTPSPTILNNIAFPAGVFESGWLWIYMYNPGDATPNAYKPSYPVNIPGYTHFGRRYGTSGPGGIPGYQGLPALGLQLQEYSNANVGGYYGDMNDIWWEADWNGWS